tara:strand:- start:656 stop:1261 length:606 start_codon:yes stop_codon:yes gene_type:complete
MIILEHEQGTDEWFAARLGKPSGSNCKRLITATGSRSTQFDGYVAELAYELYSGSVTDVFVTEWMARGTAVEPEARGMFALQTTEDVVETGFILSDCESFGCSPDALVGKHGGLEIKVPKPITHTKYIQNPNLLAADYKQQIAMCLLVTGRKHWDIFSYHETMPDVLVRVERDEKYIAKLEGAVADCVGQTNELLEKIKGE